MNRKDEIIIEAEKDLMDLIPRLKGMHGAYIRERDYHTIRNLALAANKIKGNCIRSMDTFDFVEPNMRDGDRDLLR
jgi:hypothetical protein